MDYLSYLQWGINAFFGLMVFNFWVKLRRPPQEDPRLSRGLQLLQSKIAVLEDLSDRTERQYDQLTQLLEEKQKSLQSKILNSEKQVQKIEAAIHKSLEVANLFQDKIPYKEVIERKNTLKYIEAAQMAHQGLSAEEIAQKTDLPLAEVDFISKVNREKLVFDEASLPEWAQKPAPQPQALAPHSVEAEDIPNYQAAGTPDDIDELVHSTLSMIHAPTTDARPQSLKKIGEEFRMACEKFDFQQKKQDQLEKKIEEAPRQIFSAAKKVTSKIVETANRGVEKFEFPLLGVQQRVKSKDNDNP